MINLRNLGCCGGAELIGINDKDWTPKMFVDEYARFHGLGLSSKATSGKAFMIFSYAYDRGRVGTKYTSRSLTQMRDRIKRWKEYVEKHDLGDLHLSKRSNSNPNYNGSHRIRSGMWIPNNKNVNKLAGAHLKGETQGELDRLWAILDED
jgi:hypothetical protein